MIHTLDKGIAFCVALLVAYLTLVGLLLREIGRKNTDLPTIVPLAAVPIKVTPVLDLDSPVLKLGGKKLRAKLPANWVRPVAKKRVERKAHVSTKAKDRVSDIPPKDVVVSDAGTPPPVDAAVAKKVDEEVEDEVTDAAPANTDEDGHADGTKGGTETDPLKARAISLYRGRVAGWFLRKFSPDCKGMTKEDKKKKRAIASVKLVGDGTVLSYSLKPSGHAGLDAAAKRALDASVGQQIPPPPENYKLKVPNSSTPVFVCQ